MRPGRNDVAVQYMRTIECHIKYGIQAIRPHLHLSVEIIIEQKLLGLLRSGIYMQIHCGGPADPPGVHPAGHMNGVPGRQRPGPGQRYHPGDIISTCNGHV